MVEKIAELSKSKAKLSISNVKSKTYLLNL